MSKAAKNIDWESCQSKYTDILELYREHYPSSQEESSKIEKEYPHKKEEITKVILTSKLKNIRLKFRQAIVVFLYIDYCMIQLNARNYAWNKRKHDTAQHLCVYAILETHSIK